MTSLLFFPATALLPLAITTLWTRRQEAFVRFAGCWLVPSWIVFEATPTKLIHYTLPLYGALAWLAAAGLERPIGPRARWIGSVLSILAGLAFAVFGILGQQNYGAGADSLYAALAAVLAICGGVAGAVAVHSRGEHAYRIEPALLAALAMGVAFHMVAAGALAPDLKPLWPSRRAAEMVARNHLDPRDGVVQGPVVVAGFAEPSLVFQLGTATDLGDAADAVDGLSEGQPALVEQREDAAFRALLQKQGVRATPVDHAAGYNYSSGKPVLLTLWRPVPDGR